MIPKLTLALLLLTNNFYSYAKSPLEEAKSTLTETNKDLKKACNRSDCIQLGTSVIKVQRPYSN